MNYAKRYQQSVASPEAFWVQAAQNLQWHRPWQTVLSGNLREGNVRWFDGGVLNVCENCVDRHAQVAADKVAIIWEGNTPGQSQHVTFGQLYERVCRFANLLKSRGIHKGDRVCIYMPMIVDAAVAMLACARIGAVHSVVFGGFSAHALRQRIEDADCCAVITATGGPRGDKLLNFKRNVDEAVDGVDCVHSVLVVEHAQVPVTWQARDIKVQAALAQQSIDCPPEPMAAEDPLFILYTSGSTGQPKGVLHTTAGYLLYASLTHREVFNVQPNDVYWCAADVGWITGHSYIIYGPLCNGTTTLMYEGVPEYPDASRWWQVVDTHQVNIFYTAPTAIRALMKHGQAPVKATSRQSLRVLGSVGEPINPEAWRWYHDVIGNGQCPVMDTWWQTETGGHMIAPLCDQAEQKPGAAMRPFYGIVPALLDDQGNELLGEADGHLVIKQPWPGMMRTIYGDHQRFIDTYLKPFSGYYTSGDGAHRDADGDYWITGRTDDVLSISGHRMGTAEIESALVLHDSVAEAAVVGRAHEIYGEVVYAFVSVVDGVDPDEQLRTQLKQLVREEIGPVARIEVIHFAKELPKTRSGKIMRRILRLIAHGRYEDLGDVSTLANPGCIDALIAQVR